MIWNKKNVAVIACFITVAATALFYYYKTQTTWVDSPIYQRDEARPARTLVVVYSRTGNTMGAAKEVARYFDADLLQIKAPQYARTIEGQMRASRDADNEVVSTPIQHDAVDLSRYDLIFLCSPTWWFKPAPPLWSFANNSDFAEKPVYLLMTGNSRFKGELTSKFATLIAERNGKLMDTLFIRRGRIYWQKTPEKVNKEVREAIEMRRSTWLELLQLAPSS